MINLEPEERTEEFDGELDSFLAEVEDIEQNKLEELPPEPDFIRWRECLDETTKHPYYWHVKTQEVTWVKPEDYDADLIAQENALRQYKKRCDAINKINEERQKVAEIKIAQAENKVTKKVVRKAPKVELVSENGKTLAGSGKIGTFSFLKTEAEQKLSAPSSKTTARLQFSVKKESSPGPTGDPKPPSPEPAPTRPPKVSVPTRTASGRQRTVTEISAEIKRKKQQIALTNARIHLQKRVEEQKLDKKVLDIPNIVDEAEAGERSNKPDKSSASRPESKKRRIFSEVKTKTSINEVDKDARRGLEKEALLLKEKLEFWGGDLKKLSKFQIRIIQLDTRISDFIDGQLTSSYVQSKINELAQMLRVHEENSVPKEWTCTFDREEKRYRYTNKASGKSQLTHPGEDDASSESEFEEDGGDELYEMFQQEIKQIETKTKTKVVEREPSPPPPQPSQSPPPPAPPVPVPVPPQPKAAPPAAPPPASGPVTFQGYYQGMWNVQPQQPWNHVQSFPGMPVVAPPPPPDDGMMETYSPGNSDTEEEEEKKKNLGVVSVKAPLRYTSPAPAAAPSSPVACPVEDASKADVEHAPTETRKQSPAKKPVKKKKRADGMMMSSGSKKQRNINNLVAKWNKVNKNADTALK